MQWIIEYLLSITAAAVLCVVVKTLIGKKSTAGKMVSVVTGVFMLITVLSPLFTFSLSQLDDFAEEFYFPGDDLVSQAAQKANEEMGVIIKQRSEAYILEEVRRMDLSLTIAVCVTDSDPPVPCSITVTGNISPYQKERLKDYISDNLGISQENIIWN